MCMKSAGSSPWCKNATKRGKKWRKMMRTQECCMGRTKWQAFSLQCFCCFYGLGTQKKRKRKVERPQSARDRRPAAGGQTRRLFFFCFFFSFRSFWGGGNLDKFPKHISTWIELHFRLPVQKPRECGCPRVVSPTRPSCFLWSDQRLARLPGVHANAARRQIFSLFIFA